MAWRRRFQQKGLGIISLNHHYHRQQNNHRRAWVYLGYGIWVLLRSRLAREIPLVLRFRSGPVCLWCSHGRDRIGTSVEAAPSHRRIHTPSARAAMRLLIDHGASRRRSRLHACILSSASRPSQLLKALQPQGMFFQHCPRSTSIGLWAEPITLHVLPRAALSFRPTSHDIRHCV
jgi:hypothetical protein